MKTENINPHIRFAMTFRYPIKETPLVAYDARLYYITKGKGTLTASNKTLEFEEGCVLFVPAGTPYLFSSDENIYCICLNFDFTKSNSKIEDSIFPTDIEVFDPENICDKVVFEEHPILNEATVFKSQQALREKFEKIELEFISKKHLYREIASAELKGIISELLRSSISGHSIDEKINRVLAFVQEHYSEDIQNGVIAEKFGYHPYHLNRLMRAALGTTLHKYLIFYRIEMAKRLLTSTDLTVAEISRRCGYNNFSNFSTDFKKKTSYTPLAYRERSASR